MVFFGRLVSILRTYAAFLAGVNRMAWHRFFRFNAAGCGRPRRRGRSSATTSGNHGGAIVWSGLYSVDFYYAGGTRSGASVVRST
jgi:hypothetical protein